MMGLEKLVEALWCPFLQLVESVLEGVDDSCFNDVASEAIPRTEEVPSHLQTTALCG